MSLDSKSSIFVSGARGMVGSTLARKLRERGFNNLLLPTSAELDLRDQAATFAWFEKNKPEIVLHMAAKVGGIEANRSNMAAFFYENMAIQINALEAARRSGVSKLLTLGSSCMYPRECPQPMKEEYLLSGPLEPTNEGYAVAKVAGSRMAQYYHSQYGIDFISAIPCNLYGPNDNFDPVNSHVLSALVRRFVEATEGGNREVTLWGTGVAKREFLHVEDLADALILLLEKYDEPGPINVGFGDDLSIADLAKIVMKEAGYTGEILWNSNMPDGMPRKLMDSSRILAMGWKPRISLEEGVGGVVAAYRAREV